ncbi:hypothetical protein Syun_019606 [Stephania yunnanensis]|uniref:TF-B3 domain-containing protein n=1 Tax=Stephania yunnanensis TaxID=152371 RepID=A0AAP0NXK9_9MAGN
MAGTIASTIKVAIMLVLALVATLTWLSNTANASELVVFSGGFYEGSSDSISTCGCRGSFLYHGSYRFHFTGQVAELYDDYNCQGLPSKSLLADDDELAGFEARSILICSLMEERRNDDSLMRWWKLHVVAEEEWERINKNRIVEEEEWKVEIINTMTCNKIVKETKKNLMKRVGQREQEALQEPAMPAQMRRRIKILMGPAGTGERKPIWVVKKRVTDSDVKPDLSRLFIPSELNLEEVLSAEEKRTMRVQGKNSKGVLVVKMVDGHGQVSDLDFKYWTSINKYVFTNQWTQFVKVFGVKEGWIVQIWCFRDKDSHICFGINAHP